MKTTSFLPPPAITSYVSGILVIENSEKIAEFVLPLYANGSPTLIFQSGDAIMGKESIDNFVIFGQTVQPGLLSFDGAFTLIAYFLHPHALKSLLGFSPGELTNDYIDVKEIKQAKSINLEEQLLEENILENRLSLINDFIIKLSEAVTIDYRQVFFATNELKKEFNIDSLSNLQNKLHITERSLQRLFETSVGISPMMFKRISQFHSAFQQLNKHQFIRLTDIAFENGFTDQSHFIRVFKEFTGLTPKEYLEMSRPYNPKF